MLENAWKALRLQLLNIRRCGNWRVDEDTRIAVANGLLDVFRIFEAIVRRRLVAIVEVFEVLDDCLA